MFYGIETQSRSRIRFLYCAIFHTRYDNKSSRLDLCLVRLCDFTSDLDAQNRLTIREGLKLFALIINALTNVKSALALALDNAITIHFRSQ